MKRNICYTNDCDQLQSDLATSTQLSKDYEQISDLVAPTRTTALLVGFLASLGFNLKGFSVVCGGVSYESWPSADRGVVCMLVSYHIRLIILIVCR